MARLYLLLFLVSLVLSVLAVISCLSTDEDEVRGLPRMLWVLVILLFSPAGPIAWFVAGRPRRAVAGPQPTDPRSAHPAGTARRPRRPLAPDDDPEFLRSLSARNARADEEMMRKWEDDLRRREEELRRRNRAGDDADGTDG